MEVLVFDLFENLVLVMFLSYLAIFWPRFGESPAVEMERKIYKASCQSFWRATKVIPETGARAAAGAAVNQRYTKLYP